MCECICVADLIFRHKDNKLIYILILVHIHIFLDSIFSSRNDSTCVNTIMVHMYVYMNIYVYIHINMYMFMYIGACVYALCTYNQNAFTKEIE